MKKRICGLLVVAGLCCSAPAMAEMTGNINAFIGAKGLNSDDWYADSHGEVGALFDIGGSNWPVLFAVDVLASHGDWDGYIYRHKTATIDYYEEDVKTSELNLGVRKYWHATGNMYPYVGGGLAYIRLRAEGRLNSGTTTRESGDGSGLWVGGGIQWRFDQFNLGFSVRASAAQVSLDSGDYQGGGGHTALLLGYHF
jgi:hypothetical protein